MSLVTYTKDEIISSSKMARALKEYLDQLSHKKKKKFAISRNNKIEGILISPTFLEEELASIIEHIEIFNMINQRKNAKSQENLSLSEIKKEYEL